MFEKLKNWFENRLSDEISPPPVVSHKVSVKPAKDAADPKEPAAPEAVQFESTMSGHIEDAGPGKNVLIRTKHVREDIGTHETLTIVDDSVDESGEESGIDPYNTGSFDRSKNWNNRTRK